MTKFNQTKALLADSDAILIIANSGLSLSEGYDLSAENDAFKRYFKDFQKFGIHNIAQGAKNKLPKDSHEKFIKQLHKYIVDDYQPTPAFASLRKLVQGHDYFVITFNADTHFQLNGFSANKLW